MADRTSYLIARFWSKVDVGRWGPEDCWLWKAAGGEGKHGRFRIGDKLVSPHVFAYRYFYGEPIRLPGHHGTVIRHACDNPRCCNPAHLIAGTQLDNVRDMDRKGRRISNPGVRFLPQKLDAARAALIRERWRAGEKAAALATEFNVARQTVEKIGTGRIWKGADDGHV